MQCGVKITTKKTKSYDRLHRLINGLKFIDNIIRVSDNEFILKTSLGDVKLSTKTKIKHKITGIEYNRLYFKYIGVDNKFNFVIYSDSIFRMVDEIKIDPNTLINIIILDNPNKFKIDDIYAAICEIESLLEASLDRHNKISTDYNYRNENFINKMEENTV